MYVLGMLHTSKCNILVGNDIQKGLKWTEFWKCEKKILYLHR